MKITVYQAKGGAGKTPIATNIALDREYAIGTNDPNNLFETFIPDDRFIEVDAGEPFPTIPDGIDFIFDLAGAMSKNAYSITSALLQSDLVLVPIHEEVKSLHGGVRTLRELSRLSGFTAPVYVVATKLKKTKHDSSDDCTEWQSYQTIERWVRGGGFEQPIIPLKLSTAFDAVFEREMSIADISAADPLARHSFKEVLRQFPAIYDIIDELTHAAQDQRIRA